MVKRTYAHFVIWAMAVSVSAFAQGPASVSGTVHDASGQAQIGVLVQLLSSDNTVLASVFSDENGHYNLQAASSGNFQIRATAAMYLPVVRQNIPLSLGAHTLLDLTLNTLTEALQWLPAKPRNPADSNDDWKWTLRSPANRPVLRDFDPTIILASSGAEHGPAGARSLDARATVISRSGSFASSGVHQIIALDHTGLRQHDYLFRADVVPSAAGQSASAIAATSFEEGAGQVIRMAANYQWHSDLMTGANVPSGTVMGGGVFRITQVSELGPAFHVEAGNEIEQVGWGDHVSQIHPFAAITAHPNDETTVSYVFSTTPGFSRAEDADQTIERTPLAAPSLHGLALQHGIHQELLWSRETGATIVTAGYFHDNVDDPVIQGMASARALQSSNLPAGLDTTSGILREAGDSFTAQGVELSLDHNFGPLDACVSLTDADALFLVAGPLQGAPQTRLSNGQLAAISLRGVIPDSHTRWSASYGSESHDILVPITSFNSDGPQPFLNVSIHQPLYGSRLDAVMEVRNLLAQGYHPFLAPDGETIYFMQVARSLQGGLAFSF
jgi:hypothetical protein